ncbi:GTPase [Streptomonospora salina]|uniref:Energy-coupling factor transporter ATP-binding protein EcfA2 n=1 Tax=Streptomonospora salina TaxID=104205 RepID=A0A841EG17_9ACTN|nr:GTPase [Streptomonospora salina]MBB6000289.1 energy-coupling factor transporter ATP-binding protein EcfA2 [Streptomonospora salina]
MSRPSAMPEATGTGRPAAEGSGAPESASGRRERAPVDADGRSATRHRGDDSFEARFEKVLENLGGRIRATEFAEGLPGATEGASARSDLLHQLDDYVLPRVRRPDTPLLIAVAGSTGAGKSTLVNSLVGEQVTTTGVRRPTTNSPVLACNPADGDWFSEATFLPTLPRVRQHGLAMPGKDGMLVLAPSEAMPRGVALLDTPDVDSAVSAHHEFASKFLDAADLWVFVTTSRRYADARVWEFLRVARDRGTSLAAVLSRVPDRGRSQLVQHFGAMLEANGLGDAIRFVVPETDQISGERFTSNVADPVRDYLADVAGDLVQRDRVSLRTFIGVIDSFRTRVPDLAKQVEVQVETRRTLESAVKSAYEAAGAEIDDALREGELMRGNLLARWQDIAASGELMRMMRSRGRRRPRGDDDEESRVRGLEHAVRDSLESLVIASAERAVEKVADEWETVHGGEPVVERAGGRRLPEAFVERAGTTVAEWMQRVGEMVAADGATKRSVARVISSDKRAFTLVLIVELLGYDAAGAGSGNRSGPSPNRLLRGVFGADSLRNISNRARDDLRRRIGTLLYEERTRFTETLAAVKLPEEADAVQLYQATYNLEIAR